MTLPIIRCEQVGKKFRRTALAAVRYGLADLGWRLLRRNLSATLRPDEFWAVHGVSFAAHRGECIGIIGPNGAGKSTLLRLINGDYRPDQGRITRKGAVTSLIRLGGGLQPLLTGRENIYIKCSELGFSKTETDALLDRIVEFSGLEKSLDQPVKRYSDGMYVRLEFSIATAAPMDILLIDEVLAVGDVAFQMRCLQRLDQLKQAGTTILLVSHSEMNVRHIADRCLLLFDGEALALGETDALFRKYYEATGFLDRALEPLGLAPVMPADFSGRLRLTGLSLEGGGTGGEVRTGRPLRLRIRHEADSLVDSASLLLQFWSPGGLLMATFDSGLNGGFEWGMRGESVLELAFLGLSAGAYRVAGGFRSGEHWLSYYSHLLDLPVAQAHLSEAGGLLALQGHLSPATHRTAD
jgi:ABC-type polysaccharide/polyol phosphate transport system ATPase subunit